MKIAPTQELLALIVTGITGQGPFRLDTSPGGCHIKQNQGYTFQLVLHASLVSIIKIKKNYKLPSKDLKPKPICVDGDLKIKTEDKPVVLAALAKSGKIELTEDQVLHVIRNGTLRLDGQTVMFRRSEADPEITMGTVISGEPAHLTQDWKPIPRKAAAK